MSKRPPGYLQEPQNLVYDYQQRAKEGKPLNPYYLEKDDQSLYSAIMNEFDSFDDFLHEAGFDPEKVRLQQRWTIEKIEKTLQKICEDERIIKYHTGIKDYDTEQWKVFRMMIYYFGSIKEGLKKFGYKIENKKLKELN